MSLNLSACLFGSVSHCLRFVDLTVNSNKIFRIPFCVTNSKQSAVSPIWLDLLIKKLDIALANIWPDEVQEWGSVRRCSARSIPSPPPHTFFLPDFTLDVVVLYCAKVIPVQTSHCTDNVFLLGFRHVCVFEGFSHAFS